MGRPIKQKFFDPKPDTPADGSSRILIGGEGISSIVPSGNILVGNVGTIAVTISAPQLPTGVQALAFGTANATGHMTNVTVTTAGTGYTSATATALGGNVTLNPITLTVSLAAAVTNVIKTSAYIPAEDGGSSAVLGDIIKQVGARRYKVVTAQGTGKCKLVTAAPTAGTMTITATDSLGSTYYVKKLEERLVTIIQDTDGGSGFDYTSGEKAKWSLTGSAVAPTTGDIGTVLIQNN